MTNGILPKKPSELLRIAVEDCKKIEALSNYKFDMSNHWHARKICDGVWVCVVCMAGAVMDQRLGVETLLGGETLPSSLPRNADQLRAIDCLRTGNLHNAGVNLGIEPGEELIDAYAEAIESVLKDGRAPWEIYLEQAEILERAGF